MNWFVVLLLLPALTLIRLLEFLTGKSISMVGWQVAIVSFAVYAGIVAFALLR